ncbi:MAG: segregation/condensation protein A [Chloroflexi bacterium]|jgi:segregation and condensation protein A|nr:segregation/condensation protein A [Chloroflexota bacterium]
MEIPFLKQAASKYTIETDVFEGPLDLLLQLIEKEELDITQLSLAKVTDQYLEHLRLISDRDPLEVSAFLVIAAQLVLIKSRVLLPVEADEIGELEIEGGEELVRQLIEYKKFKNIGLWLREREELNYRSYFRTAPPPRLQEVLDLSNITASDLATFYNELIITQEEFRPIDEIVTISQLTLKKRINKIIDQFKTISHARFSTLIDQNTKLEIIVTFLALLELIKNHLLEASQPEIFGEIDLEPIGNMDQEVETEF